MTRRAMSLSVKQIERVLAAHDGWDWERMMKFTCKCGAQLGPVKMILDARDAHRTHVAAALKAALACPDAGRDAEEKGGS